MFKKFRKYLIVAAGLMALAMAGCSDGGDDSTSITNPVATAIYPTGTVQGYLIDACTQKPIRNAVIDIGIANVFTNERGQYTIYNVPATKQADGKYHGEYSVTIDLRNATDPVGIKFPANTYPDFAYDKIKCSFTTLNGSGNTDSGDVTVSGNNPAVPVLGMAEGDQNFTVGALNAIIRGKVKSVSTDTAVKYVALYATRLHHGDDSGDTNSTTGADDNLVKTATVGTDGTYTFRGVEAQRYFKIKVTDTDPLSDTASKPSKTLYASANTECGGVVKWACDVNFPDPEPQCVSVNRSNFADYPVAADGSTTLDVKFTFVHPVEASNNLNGVPVSGSADDQAAAALAMTSAGNPFSIYAKVSAKLIGYKAGSTVPHSLSWNTTFTELTVSIPNTAPGAIYNVDISDAKYLLDVDCGDTCVTFYTFGANPAAATTLSLINLPYNYNDNIQLSWLPSANAKAYSVYCQAFENWGATSEVMGWKKIATTTNSVYTFDPNNGDFPEFSGGLHDLSFNFIENWKIKLTWNCKVRGVNADGTEGADSNVVTASDTVKPTVKLNNYAGSATQIEFCFNEPMSKDPAQTASNFVFANFTSTYTPPTLSNGNYSVPGQCVTFAMNKALDFTQLRTGQTTYMNILPAVTDVAGNSLEVLFLTFPATAPNL